MTTLTIGEVLTRLKEEFSDITISKIRFLEAEGLITPDRTESGYRKFTEEDIERLRYVLTAQRDRYLPLRVIKDELARLDAGTAPNAEEQASAAFAGEVEVEGDHAREDGGRASVPAPLSAPEDHSVVSLEAQTSGASYSPRELCDAADIRTEVLAELREHGLLGPGPSYEADDLRVARVAAQLLDQGLEVRHLRMYRQFADREAALIEQLVAPLLRQRNPESRASAVAQAEQLAGAGGDLHRALLVRQLRAALRR